MVAGWSGGTLLHRGAVSGHVEHGEADSDYDRYQGEDQHAPDGHRLLLRYLATFYVSHGRWDALQE